MLPPQSKVRIGWQAASTELPEFRKPHAGDMPIFREARPRDMTGLRSPQSPTFKCQVR